MRVVLCSAFRRRERFERRSTPSRAFTATSSTENFVDSYRNLTRKVIGGLGWATTYCAHARFFAKVDDDIAVNALKLVERLKTKISEKLLVCSLRYAAKKAHRGKKVSKWVVTREEYPNDNFPVNCSGWAYAMTPDVVVQLLRASLSIRFVWLEDVYVTGRQSL